MYTCVGWCGGNGEEEEYGRCSLGQTATYYLDQSTTYVVFTLPLIVGG